MILLVLSNCRERVLMQKSSRNLVEMECRETRRRVGDSPPNSNSFATQPTLEADKFPLLATAGHVTLTCQQTQARMEQEPRPDHGESTTDETNVLSHDVGLEQTDMHTQDAIIDVLAHLHPAPADSSSIGEEIDPQLRLQSTTASQTKDSAETLEPDGLEGWKNKALRQEIVRLRQLLISYGHTDLASPHQPAKKRKRSVSITTAPQLDSTVWTITEPRKTKAPLVAKDEETGKRVAKDRRLELSKAVRGKVSRSSNAHGLELSIDESYNGYICRRSAACSIGRRGLKRRFCSSFGTQLVRPIRLYESAGRNPLHCIMPILTVKWTDRIATELLEEAKNGQHDKVPVEDLTLDIVKVCNVSGTTYVSC